MGTLLETLATWYTKRMEYLNRTNTELAGARETVESAKAVARRFADHARSLEQTLMEFLATRDRCRAEREELLDRLRRYEAPVNLGYAAPNLGVQRWNPPPQ